MTGVTCIMVEDGCGFDSTGDDVHEWYVTPCDDDGEQVEGTRQVVCHNRWAAFAVADRMAGEFGGVEVVSA